MRRKGVFVKIKTDKLLAGRPLVLNSENLKHFQNRLSCSDIVEVETRHI